MKIIYLIQNNYYYQIALIIPIEINKVLIDNLQKLNNQINNIKIKVLYKNPNFKIIFNMININDQWFQNNYPCSVLNKMVLIWFSKRVNC